MKLITLSLSLALTFGFGVAQAASDPSLDTAAATLVSVLQSRLVLLDRDVTTFHYESASYPTLPTLDQVHGQLTGGPERFFNTALYNGDMQGIGLYLATDPSSSRSYGNSEPFLYVIPLKKGTRILNLEKSSTSQELQVIKDLATNYACLSADDYQANFDSFSDVTKAFRNSKRLECRTIITDAFAQMGVEAILYSYSSDSYARGCRMRNEAFNLLSSRAIKMNEVALFTNKGSHAPKSLARYVSQIYRAPIHDFWWRFSQMNSPSDYEMPSSLQGLQVFDLAAQSWRKRNMLRCGNRWSVEDTSDFFGEISSKLRQSFTDAELQKVLLEWYRAYKLKVDPHNWDVSIIMHINEVEKQLYLKSQLAPDMSKFAQWQEAADFYAGSKGTSKERTDKAAKLLEEPAPSLSDEELMKRMLLDGPQLLRKANEPGLMGAILKATGTGPRLMRMTISASMVNYGFPPMLTDELLDDPDKTYADALRNLKSSYVKLIQECTAQMLDPNFNLNAFQSSPCGVRPKVDIK